MCIENGKDNFCNALLENNKAKAVVIHDCVSLDILNVKAEEQGNNIRFQPIKLIGNVANHTMQKIYYIY
jgi:hypothetical protein